MNLRAAMSIRRIVCIALPVMAALLLLPACERPSFIGTGQRRPAASTTESAGTSEIPANAVPEASSSTGGSSTSANASASSDTSKSSATSIHTSLENINLTVMVTIPEGYTFYQVAALLETKGVCSAKAFYDAAQSYEVKSFTVKNDPNRCYKMEGYLFPDTYEFYRNANATDVLVKILNNYAQKSGLPDNDTLILASIIEHEARSAEHRAKVSAVFHNRIAAGMKLQADCTIHYVEKHIKPNSLVSNPGRYAELYNTYKCAALPAGPICSPSRSSINAAQNPASGMEGYFYYFFGNDNTNHYSKTLAEHEAQMAEYGVQYE